MSILKKPDLSDPVLRAKLAQGMGHNYYGERAWRMICYIRSRL